MSAAPFESPDYHAFITQRRAFINQRVDHAMRRYPTIQANVVKEGFKRGLAAAWTRQQDLQLENFEEVFDNLVDLLLLATARYFYTGSERKVRAQKMDALFDDIYPALLEVLAINPETHAALLFNAAENAGTRCERYLTLVGEITDLVTPETLRPLLLVLQWVTGDPRFRQWALTYLQGPGREIARELLERVFNVPVEQVPVDEVLTALAKNPWLDPREITSQLPLDAGFPTHVKYGGFVGYPSGLFTALPRLAGRINDLLVTYTPDGHVFFTMLDALGRWEKKAETFTECTQVQYFPNGAALGVTSDHELANLLSKETYPLRGTSSVHLVCPSSRGILVLHEKRGGQYYLSRFHADWGMNEFYPPTRKRHIVNPKPVDLLELPHHPAQVLEYASGRFLLVSSMRHATRVHWRLDAVTEDDLPSYLKKKPLHDSLEPLLIEARGKNLYCLTDAGVLHAVDPGEQQLSTLAELPVYGPTSFLVEDDDLYVTTRYSYRVEIFHDWRAGTPNYLRKIIL